MEIEDKIWKVPTHDPLKYKKARKKKDLLGTALGIVLALSMTMSVFGIIGEGSIVNNVTNENESLLGTGQESIIDGSREATNIRLTFGSSSDRQPSWSPDSKYIAFMSRSDGWQIKKVKLEDKTITTLPGGAGGIEPNWYPNNRVAFSRGISDPTMDVFVMNSDGSGTQRLTSTYGYDEYPDWSPGGNKIAYVSQHGNPYGNKYISVMNADGGDRRNLGAVGIQPSWSPDGTKIAFKCYNSGANICIINADGSGLRQLTSEGANTHEPDWSPNGQYIAYASKRDGDWEIYVIKPDGTGKKQLTSNSVDDNYPSWSPDGTKIAYSSFSSGNEDIWVMSFDGGSTSSSIVSVTSPNGGEYWTKGTTKFIKWTYTGSTGSNVKIELLKSGIANSVIVTSVPIGNNGYGSYNWAIPVGQTLGSDYKIRVTSVVDAVITDTSNNNFVISDPYIRVTSPNGGESWARGTTKTITWTKDGNVGSYVKIDLYKGGVFKQTIASNTLNDGSHSWTIATGQTIGSDYKIKITSTSNSAYNDMSNNNFKIY